MSSISPAALRSQVQLALSGHSELPFAYRDRQLVETVSSGIPQIDFFVGGLPRGGLTEIYGAPSSGHTTVLLSALASRTSQSEVCAVVDARDAFDPHSAQAAGVDLKKVLWVRCKNIDQALQSADLLIQGGGFGFIALDLSDIPPQTVRHVPLNAWFRFRRAIEDTPTILLILGQESNVKTCASLVLHVNLQLACWRQSPLEQAGEKRRFPFTGLLQGANIAVEMVRSRIQSRNISHGRKILEFGRAPSNIQNVLTKTTWSYNSSQAID